MCCGIGVRRKVVAWSSEAVIAHKAEWPRWTPTPSMIRREPELRCYKEDMADGRHG